MIIICMSKVICLLGAVGYSGYLHWELWKMKMSHLSHDNTTEAYSVENTTNNYLPALHPDPDFAKEDNITV